MKIKWTNLLVFVYAFLAAYWVIVEKDNGAGLVWAVLAVAFARMDDE